jgi:hypothetical protein
MAWEPYTEQQWLELTEAGPAIARGMAWISGPPSESEAELDAFVKFVEDSYVHLPAGNESLLTRLVKAVHGQLAAGVDMPAGDAMTDGLQAARKASALLELFPDAAQAREAREWLLDIGRRVAEARKEGGMFGIGGEQVSAPETDTLMYLADALGFEERPDDVAPGDLGQDEPDKGGKSAG